jgi:putative ABC transport system permease protein
VLRAAIAAFLSRAAGLFRHRALDEDFEREIGAHLDALADEGVRRGLDPEAARREAVLRFGGPMQIREQHRDGRSLPAIETTVQDLRYAWRGFRRSPAFSLVAVATLAIGIGAGTAVFSFVRAVLLKDLPYRAPGELVRIFETNPLRGWTRNIVAPANYADWKRLNTVFTDIAAYEQFNSNGSGAGEVFLTGFGEPQGLKALGVTGNLFSVLGAPALMGRTFTDEETWEGRHRVVVLGFALWQGAFGGDPGIVGRTITLSGRAYDVVGVMPPSFMFPGRDVQLWMPVGYTPDLVARSRRPHWLGVVARLKPGVSIEQAQQNLSSVALQLERQYPDTNTQMGVRIEPLHDSFAREPRTALLMLSGAAGLLFLIVCANIANLQLGRSAARMRELAIRRALGAARGRLLRQLLTESVLLSTIGGALGLALAILVQSALTRYAASAMPLFADVRIDRMVMIFALALSGVAPIVFGIMPALASSAAALVTERASSSSPATRGLRNALVASEVALSIVLVVGAVLLIRSMARLKDVDPGFRQDRAVAFTLTLPSARYPDAAARFRGFTEIHRRLREQPGVEAAGANSTQALRGFTWTGDATNEGRGAGDYERELRHASTTGDYFTAMGIPLLAGRTFAETDTRDAPQVTVVNEALARRYFRSLAPAQVVGKRITFGRPQDNAPWITIAGVVGDEKQDGMDKPAEPTAYSSIAQRQQNPLTFVVRSAADATATIAAVRRTVAEVDKDLAVTGVTTLRDVVEGSMEGYRFRTALLSGFAAVALLLAALGIYGVLAYFVSQRSRELGIRLALGAKPAQLFGHVVGQGIRPVAFGTAIGLAGAAAVTGLLRSLLFGVSAIDPGTYAAAVATLAVIAVSACLLPALRATRVDPLVALRDE